MRLVEFDQEPSIPDEDPQAEGIINLIAILNVIIERAKNEDIDPSVSTNALINMVKNTGALFDYNALLNAYETNAAVSTIIKNLSKDTVDLIGSSEDAVDAPVDAGEDSQSAVSKIAKRVANREIG